jgi:hypothetical protein
MSDNFGPQQLRVLSVSDRNLDNVVFQYRKPPLTSEWNLINQISNEKLQNLARMSYPSGWLAVEDVLQDWVEEDAPTGSVNCSASFEANSFKVIARNENIAVVNGWPINVQGTNSSNTDNIVRLDSPAGQIYDFVFLEVWRKLVGSSDPVYPYGNVLLAPYTDNEVEWAAMGTETTKRVQIQYRIRSTKINTILDPTSDVFDTLIYPVAGRSTGEYVFNSYAYRLKGAKDIGLYLSGDGSESSKEILGTVDGYSYAIPMFLVYRRVTSDSVFSPASVKMAYTSKARQAEGYVSDRPDSMLSDVIYRDDIVDYRHKIITAGKETEDLIQRTVSKLVSGELSTAIKRGFGEDGADTTASSGGGTLTKVERINSVGGDDIPDIGFGSSTSSNVFKRRAFCNASLVADHNIVELPKNGGAVWVAGTITLASAILSMPAGKITSIEGYYDQDTGAITGITETTDLEGRVVSITINLGSNLINTSKKLMIEFTFLYDASSSGFKDVPREFYEITRGVALPIATRDSVLPLRFNHVGALLNYGLNSNNGTPGNPDYIDSRDFVRYRGGQYSDKTFFGHELVLHRTTNNSGTVTVSLTDNKFAGYNILGIKSVEPLTGLPDSYGNPVDFSQLRNFHTVPTYGIDSYEVTVSSITYSNTPVKITFYTGSKVPQDVGQYSVPDSFKFFELSKQGKGIIDTYEMLELVATEDPLNLGQFILDSGDKPIISLAAQSKYVADVDEPLSHIAATEDGRYYQGTPFAFLCPLSGSSANSVPITVPAINTVPVQKSIDYTANLLPTRLRITCPLASGLLKIRVPVLVHSYVAQSEDPYNFYYKTNAYQGILGDSSSFYGKIISENKAIITTLGSGAVANYGYDEGYAVFKSLSRTVMSASNDFGVIGNWNAHARVGDYIRPMSGTRLYRISAIRYNTITGESTLTLAEKFNGVSSPVVPIPGENYEIIRLDIPHENISNVVDRLPTYKIIASNSDDLVDYSCDPSVEIVTAAGDFAGILVTNPLNHPHDPMNSIVNDFIVGSSSTAKRGRNDFQLSISGNPAFKLTNPARPIVSYAVASPAENKNLKVFQAYVFNRSAKSLIANDGDLTGRLYLMVISGEVRPSNRAAGNNVLNGFYDKDTVDLFEIVGRPIVRLD